MRRIVLLFAFLGLLRAADVKEPFFFIQMTDPQFGMYAGDKGFAQETANFEFAIATANRLHPAFVVVTGDLINKPGDAAEAAEYKRVAAQLDPSIPLYNVPGNHDVGNDPTPASLAFYRERFGPDYYTFRAGDMEGIVLNSSLIGHPEKAPHEAAKQESWLRQQLEKAREKGVRRLIVFQHHSWFLHDPKEADQYFNIPLPIRGRYLQLFHKYGVREVFAGHYHRNALGRDGPLEMVTTGPVGKPLGGANSGFCVVIVRSGGVEHHYYEFGDLPNAIDLSK